MSQESRPDVTGILPGCHRISARIRREGWPDGAGILRIARTETRHLIDYQKWLESQKNIKRTTSTIKSLEDIKPKKRRNFRKG